MKYIIIIMGEELEKLSLFIVYICFFLILVIVLFYFVCDIGEWVIM